MLLLRERFCFGRVHINRKINRKQKLNKYGTRTQIGY